MAKSKSSKPQRKAPALDKAASAKPTSNAGGISMPDTTFAVQDTAAMFGKGVAGSSAGKKETSTFKQMKEGLNHQANHSIGKLLDKTGSQSGKKSGLPFDHSRGQVGHNQTFGSDAIRTGVPRRTGG